MLRKRIAASGDEIAHKHGSSSQKDSQVTASLETCLLTFDCLQAQDWDLPHRPMTPSRILDQENGSSFMFRSGTPGPVILNRSQQAVKRGYLVKKGD